jgi:outer membrane scaffolding protein for murein synthesis (MipA/OmpV family)
MKFFALSGCTLLATALAAPAQAQEPVLPLWELGIAAGVLRTPTYPASAERASRALALPIFFYRGEVLRADRSSFGARLAHAQDYEFDVGFAASLPSNSNEIAVRTGMPDLGTLIEFGPRLKVILARPGPRSRVRLELPLRAVLEFNDGVHVQGASFEPELSFETADFGAGWRLSATGSLVVGNSQLNNYFYGVLPQFATISRPAYEARAGLMATRLGLSASKDQTPYLRVFGFVRYEMYEGSANGASPLFLQSHGTSAGVGLTWIFARSERGAAN